MNNVNKNTVAAILATADASYSPRRIAQLAHIDATSENLRTIREICFEIPGIVYIDLRDTPNGAEFFHIARS